MAANAKVIASTTLLDLPKNFINFPQRERPGGVLRVVRCRIGAAYGVMVSVDSQGAAPKSPAGGNFNQVVDIPAARYHLGFSGIAPSAGDQQKA